MYGEGRNNSLSEVMIMCNNGSWGNGSCWWIIILILLLCNCGGISIGNSGNGCGCGCDNNCGGCC